MGSSHTLSTQSALQSSYTITNQEMQKDLATSPININSMGIAATSVFELDLKETRGR